MGLAPMLARASICSVTRMVPSSAAMALPTRPANIVAANTGPSSRTSDMLITAPSRDSKCKHAELAVTLHGQHHADKRARQGHHRQAEHADLVEIRQERLASGQPRQQPAEGPQAEPGDAAQLDHPIDHQSAQVGNPIGQQRMAPPDCPSGSFTSSALLMAGGWRNRENVTHVGGQLYCHPRVHVGFEGRQYNCGPNG